MVFSSVNSFGRSVAAGTLIGAADFLVGKVSYELYKSCGGEIETRDFNADTDEHVIAKIVTNVFFRMYFAYVYVREVGVFSPNQEAANQFWLKWDETKTRINTPGYGSSNDVERSSDDEDDSFSSEIRSDIICGAAEELICRGGMQPLLAKVLSVCLPVLGKKAYIGIPFSNLISVGAIGVLFGAGHYGDYTKGGTAAALNIGLAGCIYGLAKERYGLFCSIIAHTTSNIMGHSIYEYGPRLIKYLKGTDEEIESIKEDIEWNSLFIECLKKNEFSGQPLWKGETITDDIIDDFYSIAKSINGITKEEIKSIVNENGYTTTKEVSAKIIELWSEANQRHEKEIQELEKKRQTH